MTKKILVIDDDRLVVRSLERYLRASGYDIETAQSGNEALEKSKEEKFDLIISDLRMPGMNGIETLRKIREYSFQTNQVPQEKIPIIIITGYGDNDIYQKSGELGIVDCIYKPFELDEFIDVIRRNLELPPKYRRIYPRSELSLPVELSVKDLLGDTIKTKKIYGRTVDLSEGGIGLILDSLLPVSSIVTIDINYPPRYTPFQIEASIVWGKPIFKDGHFRCGLHFLKIEDQFISILREILAEYKLIDERFVSLTKEMEQFLQEVKDRFDEFDKLSNEERKQIDFIETNKKEIFDKLDDFFYKTWEIVKDFETDKYIVHQNYYQQILSYLLLELIGTNRHIYNKPLGYAGDYIIINYIYEYHANNYLGSSSYEKLINNYTCNIPISCSNIKRKDFLKKKIIETLERKDKARVLSIASGPNRELSELLKEGKINKTLFFNCLDFEKKALDYVNNEVSKIELEKRQLFYIEYICRDIVAIIRDKQLKDKLKDCDLIYVFGIFDYLGERMAARLTRELYQLLQEQGNLIICNASLENSSHRAYYEMLGEWNIIHRTKEELMLYTRDISNAAEIKFDGFSENNNYLYLNIKKP